MLGVHPRLGQLSMDKIEEMLLDTKDTLKQIQLYNYGEPFLDKRFLDILRLIRRIVPEVHITTSTSGTVIPNGWPEIIVKEGLLNHIVFSIDGASQETYSRYRIGGDFDKAFKNMTDLIKYKEIYGKSVPEVTWQYILFEWNDSDAELKQAQELASMHGLTIQWVLTHTKGKSQRYKPRSEEFRDLPGLKGYNAGILVQRYAKSPQNALPVEFSKPTGILKIKNIWMTFFRLGGGLGDDVSNGLFLAAAIIFALLLLIHVPLFIKFGVIICCIFVVRIYRKMERDKLKIEFKEVLLRNPKDLSGYIRAFVDIYGINYKEISRPLGINSISNGKFKKLLQYSLLSMRPESVSNIEKFCNIVNKIFFLSRPVVDSIVNEEIDMWSIKNDLKNDKHYELISMFAKKYNNNFSEKDIKLLHQAICELGHNLEFPLFCRIVRDEIGDCVR
jgi:hypothetical protein